MAKAVSKNQKTARKKRILTYEGSEVKPIVIKQNPLGVLKDANNQKIPAGKFIGVQLKTGVILTNSDGIFVSWDSIASKIVEN